MAFSSRGVAFASILEIFVVGEGGNVDDAAAAAAAAKFSAIGDDAASAGFDDTSSACEVKDVEFSMRGLSSVAIASVNHKFFS